MFVMVLVFVIAMGEREEDERTVRFQIVHVVSILLVPIISGFVSFQSKDVRGAQNSEFLFWTKKQACPS
jgi:hypothetical protein